MLKYLLIFTTVIFLKACSSGPCDYPDNRASDGSRCGDRAASVRSGGRNPDLNKALIWILGIGGVVGIFAFVNNNSTKNKTINNFNLNNLNENNYFIKPVSHISSNEMNAGIEKVLWKYFNYKIDPLFLPTFYEISQTCLEKKYNFNDGATLYILAVISTMYPSKIDEKGKMFIDNKTKQCFNLIDKGTVPKIMMIKHINKVRKIMHLKPI